MMSGCLLQSEDSQNKPVTAIRQDIYQELNIDRSNPADKPVLITYSVN